VGSVPMVELLLKNKSPLNATDIAGYTPLHHAIAEGHGMDSLIFSRLLLADIPLGDTAVALLKAGAETDRKDVDGYLAIDLAPDKQVITVFRTISTSLISNRSASSSCRAPSVKA
jgi:26S proteasome non-ATPase regulatory subunit 10